MRKKGKKCRRREKARVEKQRAERSQRRASRKRRTRHRRPEQTPSRSRTTSQAKHGRRTKPAPTRKTRARAKAPGAEHLWELPELLSLGPPLSRGSLSPERFIDVKTPWGVWKLPELRSVSRPSSLGSVSPESFCDVQTPWGVWKLPKLRSLSPLSPSSPSSTENLPEQKPLGYAQTTADDPGLVARVGRAGTLPRVPYKPPTVMEVEAKLRQPGHKIWLYGERVEVPGGLIDTDRAADGDKIRKNEARGRRAGLWGCLRASWQWLCKFCCCCCCCFPKPPR
ncbi:uncharacterized protein LOC141974046 [Athene noctua]|uniref:uncharacterized protein LOC141974046 n=1 Tax=Athene noctua TaxID=126797 RepID=UPI003EB7767A